MSEVAKNLLAAGQRLFAQRGYEGASVRMICEAAGTNANAIGYHFGSKQGLYEAILERMSGGQMESAERILGRPPKDMKDLETRVLLFAEETLAAYLAEPELLTICLAESQQGFRNCDGDSIKAILATPTAVVVDFLRAARRKKLLRKGVDPAMVAGGLMERISNQVLYADLMESMFGDSVKSPKYAQRWIEQIVDLALHGALRTPAE